MSDKPKRHRWKKALRIARCKDCGRRYRLDNVNQFYKGGGQPNSTNSPGPCLPQTTAHTDEG